MANPTHYILSLFIFVTTSLTFGQRMGFDKCLKESPDRITTFCVPNNEQNVKLLENQGIQIKYMISDWLFISATPSWIQEQYTQRKLSDFYFEFAPPSLLSDTARAHHYVNEVHAGVGALNPGYTGKDVIVGFVDSGIDFNHPDFQDANGDTRVLNYWDQTMPDNASSPQPYGYGYSWSKAQIDAGQCTSLDMNAHGTTVAGQGVGNGMANGSNKGMAPDAHIVIVESDFSRPNWTLTIADACDYIFGIADDMGLPAVVNLSLGTYWGSHDGDDPAAEAMEAMIDAKYGRIIVGAAGNSGAQYRYHQQGNPTADTNFVWFVNNGSASAVFGANSVAFDLWSDLPDTAWRFAYGMDKQTPYYEFRGATAFHAANSSIGGTVYDTIWNNGNRLATIEVQSEIVGNSFHMLFVAHNDTNTYRYRFMTTGSGKYDLWSGGFIGFNNIYWSVPTAAEFPDIVNYVAPDTLQCIVSSWNCSEKIISVGNMKNRISHVDYNGNNYVSDPTPVGHISPNSSRGPSRHNVVKPDITAAGDVSLSAAPIWLLTNTAYNSLIDSGGWHARNGGTSMASPVVAGIAALYLERCPRATYQDFMTDMKSTAFTNAHTGTTPNYTYGFGLIHAQNALLEQTVNTQQPSITTNYDSILVSSTATGYQWYLDGQVIPGETNQNLTVTPPFGTYEVETFNADGCPSMSAPFVVTAGIENQSIESLLVYPNPSTHVITVEADEIIERVVVQDMNGKQILLDRILNNTFNTSNIESGTYILLITTNQKVYTSKMIQM